MADFLDFDSLEMEANEDVNGAKEHPLKELSASVKMAYVGGLLFACHADDNELQKEEKSHVVGVARSLGVGKEEVDELAEMIKDLTDKIAYLKEIIAAMKDRKTVIFFMFDMIKAMASDGNLNKNAQKMIECVEKLAKLNSDDIAIVNAYSTVMGGKGANEKDKNLISGDFDGEMKDLYDWFVPESMRVNVNQKNGNQEVDGHSESLNDISNIRDQACKYRDGKDCSQDYEKAYEWFMKGVALGDAFCQCQVGFLLFNGNGVAEDHVKAADMFTKSAEQGNCDARNWLGWMYWQGKGVSQDIQKAFEWTYKSAVSGCADAQQRVGYFYRTGYGVQMDCATAMSWFLKAAEKGNVCAESNVGEGYENGWNGSPDYFKAFEWYLKSAEHGWIWSMWKVGSCYYSGIGVAKDLRKAFEWKLKAAQHGNAVSQSELGSYYESGYEEMGVKKDVSQAIAWYKRAAAQGNEYAKERLDSPGLAWKALWDPNCPGV